MQLKDISLKELFYARLKKLILDMTSVKFESVVFVGAGIWAGKIEPVVGLSYMAVALGIKEFVDYKDKLKGGG